MHQRSSCEADSFSVSQEIPGILWKPEFQYRIHKSAPPVLSVRDSVIFRIL